MLIESGVHLAADAAVADQQDLARRAAGGAVDRPAAGGDPARARAPDACSRSTRRGAIRSGSRARWTHIGSDRMLLFSTDYPHWHFDGEDVLPDGLPDDTLPQVHDRQPARDLSAPA